MVVEPSREELEAAHCWEAADRVPGSPATTAFRRATRLHHARWREAHVTPSGPNPSAGAVDPWAAGYRSLAYAAETGANFLTPGAREAVRARLATPEPHQSLDRQRLLADLLSAPALAANLFADVTEWPDVDGEVRAVRAVRLAHAPGWLDPAYLGNLSSFDAAIELDHGVIGIDVRYHDRVKPETPKPANLGRYLAVAERSGAFAPGAIDELCGRSSLATMWLGHLLLLSMLQHPSGRWTWGRYVVVHPAGNDDVGQAVARYRGLLADPGTFGSIALEGLLVTDALRERYGLRPS